MFVIQRLAESGSFGFQYRPFWLAKWPILGGNIGHFRSQNGRYCNVFIIKQLDDANAQIIKKTNIWGKVL